MKKQALFQSHDMNERWEFMLETSQEMATLAKKLIKEDGVQVEIKADDTKVTNIDIDLNTFFINAVKATWPYDHVWGEEESLGIKGDVKSLGKNWLWMTDPIDGTSGFVRAAKAGSFADCTSSIMIGAFAPGSKIPTFASVNTAFGTRPYHVYAHNNGAFYTAEDPKHVRELKITDTDTSIIERYEENWWKGAVPKLDTIMKENLPHARKIKTSSLGTTASRVALGDIDVATFPFPSAPHDVSLSALIAHAAGATVMDLQGREFGKDDLDWRVGPLNGLIMAKNRIIAQKVLSFEAMSVA